MTEPKDNDGRNKYLVFEWNDIRESRLEVKEKLAFVEGYIITHRHGKHRKDVEYLVLNLDDEINVFKLIETIEKKHGYEMYREGHGISQKHTFKVRDIVSDIVDAIAKAKGSQ